MKRKPDIWHAVLAIGLLVFAMSTAILSCLTMHYAKLFDRSMNRPIVYHIYVP